MESKGLTTDLDKPKSGSREGSAISHTQKSNLSQRNITKYSHCRILHPVPKQVWMLDWMRPNLRTKLEDRPDQDGWIDQPSEE